MTYIYFEVKLKVILNQNAVLIHKILSRYKAISLDCELYVTVIYIYFKVKLWVIRLIIRKYDVKNIKLFKI